MYRPQREYILCSQLGIKRIATGNDITTRLNWTVVRQGMYACDFISQLECICCSQHDQNFAISVMRCQLIAAMSLTQPSVGVGLFTGINFLHHKEMNYCSIYHIASYVCQVKILNMQLVVRIQQNEAMVWIFRIRKV